VFNSKNIDAMLREALAKPYTKAFTCGIQPKVTAAAARPSIGDVAVREAVVTNGVMESSDVLVMSWGAGSPNGVASQTLKIDGKTVATSAQINGPYSQLYYSCTIGKWTAGKHTYTITTTDKKGVSASLTGSFTVTTPPGPTIDRVAVGESAAPKNYILESNDRLVVTWAGTSSAGILSQTLVVDGTVVGPIRGPYAGLYYSCAIGKRSVGTHTYRITATDKNGTVSSRSGTFTVVSALRIDATAAPRNTAGVITDAVLAQMAAAAVERLESQLGSGIKTALAGVSIRTANLPAGVLGESAGTTIWIDDDAAGYGWFVDKTPGDDSEFSATTPTSLVATFASPAANRADLLTAVMHEMGHVLGYRHTDSLDLMSAALPLGKRRLIFTDDGTSG
jgi:hypothetical protein